MSTGTIRLHRVLRAHPERVYRAFLDADAVAKWLPPYGFTCTVHHMDASVGGAYRMSFTNFRLPDREGNPDGTLDQSKGHSCSGFRMWELLLGELVQEGSDGTIMDGAGHPVNVDGQCVGGGVGLDIGSSNEQLANERARLVLVLQVAA